VIDERSGLLIALPYFSTRKENMSRRVIINAPTKFSTAP
jgi:hypothetical protein